MEVDVLTGVAVTIKRFRPVLFFENNTIRGSRPLLEMLKSLDDHGVEGTAHILSASVKTEAGIEICRTRRGQKQQHT